MEAIERAEEKQGWSYEWVVRTRPDMQINNKISHYIHTPQCIYSKARRNKGNYADDMFAVMPRRLGLLSTSVFSKPSLSTSHSFYITVFTAHYYMKPMEFECPSADFCEKGGLKPGKALWGCNCWMNKVIRENRVHICPVRMVLSRGRMPESDISWVPEYQKYKRDNNTLAKSMETKREKVSELKNGGKKRIPNRNRDHTLVITRRHKPKKNGRESE